MRFAYFFRVRHVNLLYRYLVSYLLSFICLMSGINLIGIENSYASLQNLSAGMLTSGTAPWSIDDTSGNDSTGSNTIIRTHDTAFYEVGFSNTTAHTHARLILHVPTATLPWTYIGSSNPEVAFFSLTDIPTGPSGCQNIKTSWSLTPAEIAWGLVSGVSPDRQTLICVQPSPTNAGNLIFRMNISGSAPNGGVQPSPGIEYVSDQQSLTGNVTPLTDTTHFWLPSLTISATPRWNMKLGFRDGVFVPWSWPNGEDGFLVFYDYQIYATGSRKWLEALASDNPAYPITFSTTFSSTWAPNALWVDWNINVPYRASANMSSTGYDGCANYLNLLISWQNYFDNYFSIVGDQGNVNNTTNERIVARGGTCRSTAIDNTNKVMTFTLTGTDFSLRFYPTKNGYNPAASNTVDPSNLDAPTNQWWVAHKSSFIWVPETDIPAVPLPSTRTMTSIIHFSGTSITGQDNVEPNSSDNSRNSSMTRFIGWAINISFHAASYYINATGVDYATCDPNYVGDCRIFKALSDQTLSDRIRIYNNGTTSFGTGYFCYKIDNARFTFADFTDPSITSSHIKDPLTGVVRVHYSGPRFPITWRLGIGGTGTTNGTWTSYNTVASEYSAPSVSGSAQSDDTCSDPSITWYDSIADLIASGHTLKEITRVRWDYPEFPSSSVILTYVPLKINSSYSYSSTDNPPGTVFTVGESTYGKVSVGQVVWFPNMVWLFSSSSGIAKSSDALRITDMEYAQIVKSTPSHPLNNQLVSAWSIIDYRLLANVFSSTSQHTTDVIIWDILPPHMSYIPGSSTLWNASIPDPVCQVGWWPSAGSFSPPTGTVGSGYTACRWIFSNQGVPKIKNATFPPWGNLPYLDFKAYLDINTPANTVLLNTSFADSTNNLRTKAVYQWGSTGFQCLPWENCSFSNYTLRSNTPSGIFLSKQTDHTLISQNAPFSYTLYYGAIGNALAWARILDVLPYTGDDRGSSMSGTLTLDAFITPPATSTGIPATVADPNIDILYTKNTPSQIIRSPHDSGHDITGSGTNSITTTNWCTIPQFWSPDCPLNLSEVTAFMAVKSPLDTLPAGNTYALTVPVLWAENTVNNVYTNTFIGNSPDLIAPNPISNSVSTRVVVPDITLIKNVTPSAVTASDPVLYTITVRNNSGSTTGPIRVTSTPVTTITVTDTLPSYLSFPSSSALSGNGWDCSSSVPPNSISCTYTVTSEIGVNALIGGPITVQTLTDIMTPQDQTVTNTGWVSMSGQTESSTGNNISVANLTLYKRNLTGTLIAVNDSGTTNANTPVILDVTSNDVSITGTLDMWSFVLASLSQSGTVTCTAWTWFTWNTSTENTSTGNISTPTPVTCTYTPNLWFAGTDTFTYTLCLTSPHNTICDTGRVIIQVNPTITAEDDDFRLIPISWTGGTTPSVLPNDTMNGASLSGHLESIVLTPWVAPLVQTGSITMDVQGIITVTPDTSSWIYIYPYTICLLAPYETQCAQATATFIVESPLPPPPPPDPIVPPWWIGWWGNPGGLEWPWGSVPPLILSDPVTPPPPTTPTQTTQSTLASKENEPKKTLETLTPMINRCDRLIPNRETIDQWNTVTEAFKLAHKMLYNYELTQYQGTRDFWPERYLTREEAARFVVEFAINVLCRSPKFTYTNQFNDLQISDPTLTPYIRQSYEYGIFYGDWAGAFYGFTTTFRPKDSISEDELIAVIIRTITDTYNDTRPKENWAKNYYNFLNGSVKNTQLRDTIRWNVAETIYDLFRNNQFIYDGIHYILEEKKK